jgi:hypothetical protein
MGARVCIRAATLASGALPLTVLLTGCATTNLAPPIASFQKSMTTTSAAIGTAFNNLNEIQRQLYLDEVALDPEKEVGIRDSAGEPTPLLGRTFQAPSIKARMDSLTLLANYAQKLTSLVGNSPGEQLSEIAKKRSAVCRRSTRHSPTSRAAPMIRLLQNTSTRSAISSERLSRCTMNIAVIRQSARR